MTAIPQDYHTLVGHLEKELAAAAEELASYVRAQNFICSHVRRNLPRRFWDRKGRRRLRNAMEHIWKNTRLR